MIIKTKLADPKLDFSLLSTAVPPHFFLALGIALEENHVCKYNKMLRLSYYNDNNLHTSILKTMIKERHDPVFRGYRTKRIYELHF